MLDGASYAELLGWYLGDGSLVAHSRDRWVLSIVNDVRYERLNRRLPALMTAVKPGSSRGYGVGRTGSSMRSHGSTGLVSSRSTGRVASMLARLRWRIGSEKFLSSTQARLSVACSTLMDAAL